MISFVILLTYCFIFIEPFFPNINGNLGHDYEIWFPRMLAGDYYFYTNGLSVVPWFTPSFCGGTLLYSNPQYLFYSIPQFLSFYLNPILSIKLTIILFSSFGYFGFYIVLRNLFNMSKGASIFGAVLFLFNGFFTYRMIIGHLSFHSFMLMPLISYYLFTPTLNKNYYSDLALGLLAALLMSYVVYSGGVHLLIPICLCILTILLLTRIITKAFILPFQRILLFSIATLSITASKISASFATLSNLPRDYYPLPGIDNIFYSVWTPMRSIFFNAYTSIDTNKIFMNSMWTIDKHEMEYSLTFIPFILIIYGFCLLIKNKPKINRLKQTFIVILFILSLIPILINFYNPYWNGLLKQIPIIKNSVMLVRWYVLYIPIVIILSSRVIDKIENKKYILPVLILLIISIKIFEDKNYYHNQNYSPEAVMYSHSKLIQTKNVPTINGITSRDVITTNEGKSLFSGDSMMSEGLSRINCNESLFGYRHEDFKKKSLLQSEKSVFNLINGEFNMKNPACYIFPKENYCEMGDHFKEEQINELKQFTEYKGFDFKKPMSQKVFNWLSPITLILCLSYLVIFFIVRVKQS